MPNGRATGASDPPVRLRATNLRCIAVELPLQSLGEGEGGPPADSL